MIHFFIYYLIIFLLKLKKLDWEKINIMSLNVIHKYTVEIFLLILYNRNKNYDL
jgi:hypothetical protein